MAHMTFELGAGGRVVIDGCRGDVEISGGDYAPVETAGGKSLQVEITGERSLAGRVSQSDGEITIRGYNGDLELNIGCQVPVVGRRIDGDVTVSGVDVVEIERVGGDVEAEGITTLRADHVGGDLDVSGQNGEVEIGRVGGDLRVEQAGSLRVEVVGGDAELTEIDVLAGLGRVGGDLELRWSGKLAAPISGAVGGDAELGLSPESSFVLRALVGGDVSGQGPAPVLQPSPEDEGPDLRVGKRGWDVEAGGGELTMTFGGGGHELQLTIGGDLEIDGGTVTSSSIAGGASSGISFGDFGLGDEMRRLARDLKTMGRDLARDLTREVRSSTRTERVGRPRIGFQINDRAFQFDAEQVERLTREAREAASSGIAMAQEAVERALVNMASASRGVRGGSPRPPEPPRGPNPPRPGAWTGQTVRIEREQPRAAEAAPQHTETERLAILRMVSEGRLGIDEAEVMLRALEGRG